MYKCQCKKIILPTFTKPAVEVKSKFALKIKAINRFYSSRSAEEQHEISLSMLLNLRLFGRSIIVLLLLLILPDAKAQNPGDKMPDIGFINPAGERLFLSGMQNKYVFINFGATWCPSFSVMEPGLIKLEKQYSGRTFTNADGFEVINISLDTSTVAWKQGLEKYGGGVKNEIIATEGFDSPVAKAYDVTILTTSFFIGPGNRLIGKNMKFSEIEQLLNSGNMVEEVFYRVFLMVLNPYGETLHSFAHVSHLGKLYRESNQNNTVAYYLGDYYSYSEAQVAMLAAKDLGYQDATVVTIINNLIQPAVPAGAGPAKSTPKQQGNEVGIGRNALPPFTPPPVAPTYLSANNSTATTQPPASPAQWPNSDNLVRYLLPPEISQKTLAPSPAPTGLSAKELNEITAQLQQIRQRQEALKAELQQLDKQEKELSARLQKAKAY